MTKRNIHNIAITFETNIDYQYAALLANEQELLIYDDYSDNDVVVDLADVTVNIGNKRLPLEVFRDEREWALAYNDELKIKIEEKMIDRRAKLTVDTVSRFLAYCDQNSYSLSDALQKKQALRDYRLHLQGKSRATQMAS